MCITPFARQSTTKNKLLANILKKATIQRVNLTKVLVKVKKAGKVVSVEHFSSNMKASVDNLSFATIDVPNYDTSVLTI